MTCHSPYFEVSFQGVRKISAFLLIFLSACSSTGNKNVKMMRNPVNEGNYKSDTDFLAGNKIKTIELRDTASEARVLIVPAYQGRVMTSTDSGDDGISYGWINYRHIESGKISSQFNPYGGEERLWLGPEGGPFSIYFKQGSAQVFDNWVVPAVIDTEPFDVIAQSERSVSFKKEFSIQNASGTDLEIAVEREVRLLGKMEAETALGLSIDPSLSFVAYESENILKNRGKSAWTEKSGTVSLWMLGMFNPSPSGVVFIPFISGSESELGRTVNDDYFGKVPSDRLIIRDGILFFKTDGKFRSKIGISPARALPFCGSYDPEKQVLTILWYSSPVSSGKYVNSKWGDQSSPFEGDVVNSYNDGPGEDGSIMGPFYEIESSSPAAFLSAGERISHSQRIFHVTGPEEKLSIITEKLFNTSIAEIKLVFR